MKFKHLGQFKKELWKCGRCAYCVDEEICPSYRLIKFESGAAKGRILIARALLNDKLDFSSDLAENLNLCFMCGACKERCKTAAKIDTIKIFLAMRKEAIGLGLYPEKLLPRYEKLKQSGNPFGLPKDERGSWAEEFNLPSRGETLYFVGCYESYVHSNIPEAFIKILEKAEVTPAYLGNGEPCCGHLLIWEGRLEDAKEYAKKGIEAIERSGAKRVIFSCPACYTAFKVEYPEILGIKPSFEVLHATEFLANLIEQGKIMPEKEIKEKVTYHDPCSLGRHSEVYDAPRKILRSIPGLEVKEMERNGRFSFCCGSGSGAITPILREDFSKKIGKLRLEEAKKVADTIVTECPQCLSQFRLVKSEYEINIKLKSLIMILAKALSIDAN